MHALLDYLASLSAVTETFSVAEFKDAFEQSTASYRSLIETRFDLDHTIMVDNPYSGIWIGAGGTIRSGTPLITSR